MWVFFSIKKNCNLRNIMQLEVQEYLHCDTKKGHCRMHLPHYPSRTIILLIVRSWQIHIIHFQLCSTQNNWLNYSYEFKFMPLDKDLHDKAHKLNYLYPYSSTFQPLTYINIYLQLLPLITHFGVSYQFPNIKS